MENLNAASENRPSHSGRPKKRTAKLVESVRESLQQSPKRSVRKRSQSLGESAGERYQGLPIQNTDAVDPYSLRQEAEERYGSQDAREDRGDTKFP